MTVEGGFSDDPRDCGNWTGGRVGSGACHGTKYGISSASFPLLDIRAVSIDQAKALYLAHYWAPILGDRLPLSVAAVVFDQAVNQGVHSAVVTLQRAVRVPADGVLGPETIAAVDRLPPGETVIEICAQRALAYAGAAGFAIDGLGWMRRLFRLAQRFAVPIDTGNTP